MLGRKTGKGFYGWTQIIERGWTKLEFKYILYEKGEGIAAITINRPEALNALQRRSGQRNSASP
ncbi:hypothetical protein KEJ37_07170 [Candidatus Bathyarchaeota archaeon]|nr:hypothetical protein [Candidatus Bathyarchaeota archaeon]